MLYTHFLESSDISQTSLSPIFQTVFFQASDQQAKPSSTIWKSTYILTSGYPTASSLLHLWPMAGFLLTTVLQSHPGWAYGAAEVHFFWCSPTYWADPWNQTWVFWVLFLHPSPAAFRSLHGGHRIKPRERHWYNIDRYNGHLSHLFMELTWGSGFAWAKFWI